MNDAVLKQTRWQKRLLFWAYIILACVIVRAAFFYQHLVATLQIPAAAESPFLFSVDSGQSFTRLSERLEAAGIIDSSFDFRLFARLSGKAQQVQAGEYVLDTDMNALDLLEKMVSGDIFTARSAFRKAGHWRRLSGNCRGIRILSQPLIYKMLNSCSQFLGQAFIRRVCFFPTPITSAMASATGSYSNAVQS